MKDEIFREPLENLGQLYIYTWNEHSLFQMQWVYSIPQNFLARAEEAAKKGYDLKLLRETSQREASETTPG